MNNPSIRNVVTMLVFSNVDESGNIQTQTASEPEQWNHVGFSADQTERCKFIDLDRHVNLTHKSHLILFLAKKLKKVASQQRFENGKYCDDIDVAVAAAEHAKSFKKCFACGATDVAQTKKICPYCHKNFRQSRLEHANDRNAFNFIERQRVQPVKNESQVFGCGRSSYWKFLCKN